VDECDDICFDLFLLVFFLIQKQIAKNNKNIFLMYCVVLVFSVSFQENKKLKNLFLTRLIFNTLISKSLINFIELILMLFFFQKYKNTKKNNKKIQKQKYLDMGTKSAKRKKRKEK